MNARSVAVVVIALGLLGCGRTATQSTPLTPPSTQSTSGAQLVVSSTVLHPVNDMLFGQFLERNTGEPGPEAAIVPGQKTLQPKVLELIKEMHVPIIRYPGGTEIDYMDWTDLISNAPGRASTTRPVSVMKARSITNEFGLDEYFLLRDELKCETILVVNFLDALNGKRTVEDAGQHAAGMVAYVNAPVGAKLQPGMPDWPAVREKNGRREPFHVKYFQIGNEWFGYAKEFRADATEAELAETSKKYTRVIIAYADAMRAVDPSIVLIMDSPGNNNREILKRVVSDPAIRQRVQYVTLHSYAPGGMNQLKKDGQPWPANTLSAKEWWQMSVGMPGVYSSDGQCLGLGERVAFARQLGYRTACTEWNWNGFGKIDPPPAIGFNLAAGIGAAGFLHGLMRYGDSLDIATQSNLIGASWRIGAVHVDREGKADPYRMPTGRVTTLYATHHGPNFLDSKLTGVATYHQPYSGSWMSPPATVAYLDAVVTGSDSDIFIHLINRNFEDAIPLSIDLKAFDAIARTATVHQHTGRLNDKPAAGESPEACRVDESVVKLDGKSLQISLPCRSVTVIQIPRTAK